MSRNGKVSDRDVAEEILRRQALGHNARDIVRDTAQLARRTLAQIEVSKATQPLLEFWLRNTPWIDVSGRWDLQFVDGKLPKGQVLDLGAGTTFMTHLYAATNPRAVITACDSDRRNGGKERVELFQKDPELRERMVSEAQRRICAIDIAFDIGTKVSGGKRSPNVSANFVRPARPLENYLDAQCPNIPVLDASFEGLIAMRVFDYLDDPIGFFQEAQRILDTRRGKILMNVYNPFNLGPWGMMTAMMSSSMKSMEVGAATLQSGKVQKNLFAECLQRFLVIAASHGFEMTRLAHDGYAPSEFDVHSEPSKMRAWEKCEALFPGRINEGGIKQQLPEIAPETLYFEFTRKEPDKIFVPTPEAWQPFVDGTNAPERIVQRGLGDALRIQYLPSLSRKPIALDGAMR